MKLNLSFLILFQLCILTAFAQQSDSIRTPGPFDEGYFFVGPDDLLKFKGYAHMDAYFSLSDSPDISEFLVRRARLAATGYLQKNFRYMLYARFDRGKAQLNEAFLESRHLSFARLRVGQFKVPFSLSNLASSSQIGFVDRPLVVENLSPGYDMGAMLFGKIWNERIDYAMGVFNGEGQNNKEVNSQKDFIGRLVLNPFKSVEKQLFNQLYFGASASYGAQNRPFKTTDYETGTGYIFYSRTDSTLILGKRKRTGLDIEWIVNKGSIRAEYIQQENTMSRDKENIAATDKGYYIDFAYFLSSEKQQRNNTIKPDRELDPQKGFWGAFEFTMRYETLYLSDQTFLFQNIEGVNQVNGYSAGLNWYPNDDVKVVFNYQKVIYSSTIAPPYTHFQSSNLIKLRFQYQF